MKATYAEILGAMNTFKAVQVIITYDGGKKNNTPCKLAESLYKNLSNELYTPDNVHILPTDRIFEGVKSFTFF